jgi:hypothetical protein
MIGDKGFTPERILALAGTAALIVVMVVIFAMVTGSGDDEGEPTAVVPTRTPQPTPSPTPTPKPSPTPPPLTPEQKTQRDAAVQVLLQQGYEAVALKRYRGDQTLRVLLGRPQGVPEGGRRAFFFVDGRMVGTDAPENSNSLSVFRTTDEKVTLRYRLYAPGDEACCPTAGEAKVRFEWDGQRIQVLDLVPQATVRKPQGI